MKKEAVGEVKGVPLNGVFQRLPEKVFSVNSYRIIKSIIIRFDKNVIDDLKYQFGYCDNLKTRLHVIKKSIYSDKIIVSMGHLILMEGEQFQLKYVQD